MKILLLNIAILLISLLTLHETQAQTQVPINAVNFPDPTFRKYIMLQFDVAPKDSVLSTDELTAAASIEITNNDSLYSVKGIELFPALRHIHLQNNPNLGGTLDISGMPLLQTVWAFNTGIRSLATGTRSSPLYSQLAEIRVSNAAIEGRLDISRMPALQSLQASNNRISFVDVQQSSMFYTQLRELYLDQNNLATMGNLVYLFSPTFTNLRLENNMLSYAERPLIDSINFILSSNLSTNTTPGWNPSYFRNQRSGIDLLSETNPYAFNPFLVYFKAELTLNNGVELQWLTKEKTDIDHFEIIRSVDRVQEQPLGTQRGRWFRNSYRFVDNFQPAIATYYRLRIIDTKGHVWHSPWLYVTLPTAGEQEVTVFPHPAQIGDNVVLSIRDPKDFTFILTDLNGVVRMSGSYFNISQLQFSTLGLSPGSYRIIIQTDKDRYDRRFFIQ